MQVNFPLLSVIIPCYNYERYIGECIASVVSQNDANLEVIVINDGSTDRSWEEIQVYADRVTAVSTENQGGLKAALTGFRLSKGAFVYFLDADDVLASGAIEEITPYLRPDVSKIQFMLSPIDQTGQVIGNSFPPLRQSDDSQILIHSIREKGCYMTPPTSGNIYRRDVYEGLGELPYERAIDGVAYLLAPFVGQVISLARVLGKYRIHDANQSSFSVMSSTRMAGYTNRFLKRLEHLSQLVSERRSAAEVIPVRDNYAYVMQLKIVGKVLDGERPTLQQVTRYLRAIVREETGKKRLVLAVFAIAMLVLKNGAARNLAALRMDPSSATQTRSALIRVFSR